MLLTRAPLPLRGARLACVRPAASVRSEPGSNSQVRLQIRSACANQTLLLERSTPVLRPELHLSHLNHPTEPARANPVLIARLALRDTAPTCLCPSIGTKPPAAYPFSTLIQLVQDPSALTQFPRLQSRIRPPRLPFQVGPPGQKQRCNLSDFLVQPDFHPAPPSRHRRFAFARRRVAVGEAVYRGVTYPCQTLCDENSSNSIFSPRGAFPRSEERRVGKEC